MRLPALAALLLLLAPAMAGPAPLASWDILAPVPQARTEVSAVGAGGKVYVLGGLLAGGGATGRVDVYDPGSDTWAAGPALPTPIHHTQMVALGDRIVVVGGYVGPSFTPTALTWVLDASLPLPLQVWVPFVPLPGARGAHAAATDGQRVWVFGGVGPGNVIERSTHVLEAGVWRRLADLPDAREHLSGGWLEGKVLAAGGRKLSFATNTARLDILDPGTGQWVRGPDMPTPRGGIAAAPFEGKLVVFGGEATGGVTFAQAEGYDPAGNAWVTLPPMPHRRHGLGAAALGGAVYVEAGGPVAGLTVSAHNERLRS